MRRLFWLSLLLFAACTAANPNYDPTWSEWHDDAGNVVFPEPRDLAPAPDMAPLLPGQWGAPCDADADCLADPSGRPVHCTPGKAHADTNDAGDPVFTQPTVCCKSGNSPGAWWCP